jgi:hypothetical protein
MGALSQRFEEKYGINATVLAEEILLDFPVKSTSMEKSLEYYFERKDSKIEVGVDFLKEFVEALADSKYILPGFARINFEIFPTFEVPKIVGSIPKSKGLIYDFKGIVGSDDLRPAMMGVFIDEKGFVVGTDAHKLISVKTKELSTHAGKIIDVKRYIDSAGKRIEYIDQKYPNYEAIIPKNYIVEKDVDLVSLNNYLAGCEAITKNVKMAYLSFNVNFIFGDVPITFNLFILQSIVKFFLARGFERANFEYEAANRALLIKSIGDEVWGLVMPILSDVGDETSTKRINIDNIESEYSIGSQVKPKTKKAESPKSVKGKYDISKLSSEEQAQAQELIDAIETFEFLLDSTFGVKKMATGGLVEAFSSPQLVDGMYGAISVFAKGGVTDGKQMSFKFADGGQTFTRKQRIDAYNQMLARGGMSYSQAQEQWNKDAGLPTKKEALEFVKEHPEILLSRGGKA